ncbi:MAG: DUF342 domain-containing protein [Candidatus Delongbacteria bacterium]|nr:DUF342 domain-containing protein [Candidatus Delongbacteria bacterium]MBN2836142.1 DUF342 domain-containing protein [Candidatus Delongbacteria bacterium]
MNKNFDIVFENDNTLCYVKFHVKPIEFDKKELYDELELLRVVYGIEHDLINSYFDINNNINLKQNLLIAQGKKPTKGLDGKVEYLINDTKEISEDENGNINFYDVGVIKKMEAATPVVRIIDPQYGEAGVNVFGNEVPGLLGRNYPYGSIMGEGLVFNDNVIYSNRDGCYKKDSRGKITIANVIEVRGNLDFEIGNLDAPAIIVIHGDILPNFSCETKYDLEVFGVIENARINVGENLICRSGFVQGDEPIDVGKDIRVKYISNRNSISCKNLYVKENIFSSNILCKGHLEAKKVSGGEIWVKNEMIVSELGNEQFQNTIIRIGLGEEDARKMQIYEQDIELIENEIEQIKGEIRIVANEENSIQMARNNPWRKHDKLHKTKLYNKLVEIKEKVKSLEEKIDHLNEQKEKTEQMLKPYHQFIKLNKSRLIVTGELYPNVKIIINSTQVYEVSNQMKNVVITLDKFGEIKPFDNEGGVVLKGFRF